MFSTCPEANEASNLFVQRVREALFSITLRDAVARRSEHDQAIISARRALGEDMFATMWKLGEAMTVGEAVRYALEET